MLKPKRPVVCIKQAMQQHDGKQANRLSMSCIIDMNMTTHRTLCESPVSARIGNAIVDFLEQPKHISERTTNALVWSGILQLVRAVPAQQICGCERVTLGMLTSH